MTTSWLGRLLGLVYGRIPLSRVILALIVRLEGGEMRSSTLRLVLARHHGVRVGPHAYGSLLIPGMADSGTSIGAYASIGPGVRRFGAAHPLDAMSLHPYWYNPSLGYVGSAADVERTGCVIEPDVWIGANVIILPGCREIGHGAVIGAGAVVTRDIPAFAVAVGNPARVVATRLSAETRAALLNIDFEALSPEELKRVLLRVQGSGS